MSWYVGILNLFLNEISNRPDIFLLPFQHIDFVGRRPGLVIFATMIGVIVNWTTTLGIFLITCEAVVMKRTYILKVRRDTVSFLPPSIHQHHIKETDILGVCLTALFALPSIRAILPGSPEFGAIGLSSLSPPCRYVLTLAWLTSSPTHRAVVGTIR